MLRILYGTYKQIRHVDLIASQEVYFSTGTFPETTKIVKIMRVFKKDDKLDCNNYRTISLLPNLSKIFEKN